LHSAAENDALAATVLDALPRLSELARQVIRAAVSRPEPPKEALEAAKALLQRSVLSKL